MKNRKAKKPKTVTIICMTIILLVVIPIYPEAQLASGSKFLGNILGNNIPSNFANYWNQVTPENAGKWGSVEPGRDSMNWGSLDNYYDYAKNRGFPFKQHTFVWGNQEPGWVSGLSSSEQLAEVTEWIQAYCQRYPNTDY